MTGSLKQPAVQAVPFRCLISRFAGYVIVLCLLPLLLGFTPLSVGQDEEPHFDRHIHFWVDESGAATLDDVLARDEPGQWQIQDGRIANHGFTNAAYWYRVAVQNEGDASVERLLEIDYPLLGEVDLYQLSPDGELIQQIETGLTRGYDSRPISVRNFAFPFEIGAGETHQLLIRVHTQGAHQVPFRVMAASEYGETVEAWNLERGIFYGILMVMIAVNLFIFITTRDRSSLLYALTMGALLLMLTNLHGVAFQYLYPDHPQWFYPLMLISGSLLLFCFCRFAQQFLNLSETMPRAYWLLGRFSWMALAALPLALVLPYSLVAMGLLGLMIPVCLMVLWVGGALWQQGQRSGQLFVIGWSVLLAGIVLGVSSLIGLVGGGEISRRAIEVGIVVQAVLMSFAVGERYTLEREGRLKEQRARIAALRQREEAEAQILDNARHHSLTGLPNRAFLEDRLNEELRDIDPQRESLALVLLHFRGFDDVNKTLGHENADQLLCQLAARMNDIVLTLKDHLVLEPSHQTPMAAAHVEGITFACAFRTRDRERVSREMFRLADSLQEPMLFRGLSLDVRLVGGCSFYPEDSDTVATLLRHAFIAFDQADSEFTHVATYHPDINPYSERRLTLMTELRRAINEDTLEIYLQPQVRVQDYSVCGCEVLLRWNHPEYGFIPPDEFIPMAEQTGLIQPLTAWVVDESLRHLSRLHQKGWMIGISANISAVNLQDPGFAESVQKALQDHRIDPHYLMLEVTETATMINPRVAMAALRTLTACGIRLAVDDFGTGYSSLSYIRKLPLNEIKIDRSFVMDMDTSRDDATIVRTTINMCHDLGYEVVAEGVESEATCRLLQTLHCDIMQGYHLARPMPAAKIGDWLTAYETDRMAAP